MLQKRKQRLTKVKVSCNCPALGHWLASLRWVQVLGLLPPCTTSSPLDIRGVGWGWNLEVSWAVDKRVGPPVSARQSPGFRWASSCWGIPGGFWAAARGRPLCDSEQPRGLFNWWLVVCRGGLGFHGSLDTDSHPNLGPPKSGPSVSQSSQVPSSHPWNGGLRQFLCSLSRPLLWSTLNVHSPGASHLVSRASF